MTPPIALLVGVLTTLVPLSASVWLIRAKSAGWVRELARLLFATAITVFFLIAGPWVWLTYWLRPATAVIVAVSLLCSARRMRTSPVTRASAAWTAVMMAAAAAFVAIDVAALKGATRTTDAIPLEFPLRGGTFVVLQGGRSLFTNPFHYASPAGRLSLDIVAVSPLGTRAQDLLSDRISDYFTYGVPVTSPCTGEVTAAVDGLADNPPGHPDMEHPPGNHLLLRCDVDRDVIVLLAHLKARSVRTRAGDRVLVGDVVGAVGNSGNTSEPHLHIQATRGDLEKGSGVPMTFGRRFLTANNLMFTEGSRTDGR